MPTFTSSHSVWPLRHTIYEIIEVGRGDNRVSRAFDTFILTLILLNVAAFVLETVPAYGAAHKAKFEAFNIFSVAIFTVEYALRLWTAVEVPFLRRYSAWQARLKLAITPALIIDLLAILPFYLSMMTGLDLRVLRVLRLLRFLKLSRYSPALHTLVRVLEMSAARCLEPAFCSPRRCCLRQAASISSKATPSRTNSAVFPTAPGGRSQH